MAQCKGQNDMGKDATIRLLIADDCFAVRYGLRLWLRLEPDMEVVGEACDGTEALTMALRLRPSVIVMDARMPHMDGITATKQLRALLPETPVLLLSIDDDPTTRARALAAGATRFLSKFETLTTLPEAIRAAAESAIISDEDVG
jgi:DNA-binding NarL/FixJ family response regulator